MNQGIYNYSNLGIWNCLNLRKASSEKNKLKAATINEGEAVYIQQHTYIDQSIVQTRFGANDLYQVWLVLGVVVDSRLHEINWIFLIITTIIF